MKTDMPPSSLFWVKVLSIGIVSVPVLLLRFSYVLSGVYKGKLVIYFGYFMTFSLMILSALGYFVVVAEYSNGVFTYELGFAAYIYAVYGSIFSVLALAIMVLQVKRNEISIKKVRLVIIGLSLVIVGAALNLNTTLGEYGIDILFNAINAVLITYSIYRNKFLEINIIVKKGLSISLYNIALVIVYTTTIVFAYQFLMSWGITKIYLVILFMAPIFFVLEALRRVLFRLTNHIFFRATTDRQIILREFSNLVNSAISLDIINKTFIEAISNGIDSKQVSIMLKNSTKYILSASTLETIDYTDSYIKFSHPIVSWFSNGNSLLLSSQINNHISFKGLWDQEKRVIKMLDTEIVAPIKYLDELIGMVIISGRNDEAPYSEDETDFLQTIINNAAAIIENAKTVENIKKQSITDELTKLYNHRYLYESVGKWMTEKTYEKFSIAMIDIDQFKIYNDLYGHLAGDIALKRIAEILNQNSDKNDLLVRYGGEEFVIFMPDIDGPVALKAIEKIRRAVEDEFLLSSDIKEFLTVTIGVASYPRDGNSLEDVIGKSDKAMFYGKQSGRNKAVLFLENQIAITESDEIKEKIKEAHLQSIYALAATIDAKDHYTYGHSNNVALISAALAKEAKFSDKDVEIVKSAGLLHDIGKVGIPESVLSKVGLLDDDEMEIMRSHVVQSINIIKHIPNLLATVPIIISHHERYDGEGYPRGIKGNKIPVLGRIICIADSFDAMTTDRPYKRGLSLEQAIDELKINAGKQFDPGLVEIFIEMIKLGKLDTLSLENRPSL
ncbi:MAG: diguanylate cyclase [Candidatus Izimaplasma sp.]|nr:diguanylate cyclase [Candidatus Izimaplasma bacterium]